MALRRTPHHAFRPSQHLVQFLYFRVAGIAVFGQGQAFGVEYLRVRTQKTQNAFGFQYRQAAVRHVAIGAVQQQNARWMRQGFHGQGISVYGGE